MVNKRTGSFHVKKNRIWSDIMFPNLRGSSGDPLDDLAGMTQYPLGTNQGTECI